MAVGGILATALNSGTARAYGLFVDGTDVVYAPGTTGNQLGTPIESVRVTEAGPGGVSSIEFDIEDPGATMTIQAGATIRLHDIVRDVPLFDGWVQSWSQMPDTAYGRVIHVTGVGGEIILDWAIVTTSLTIPTLTTVDEAISTVLGNTIGVRDLRMFRATADSTQAGPIATFGAIDQKIRGDVVVAAGTPLREALRLLGVAARLLFVLPAQTAAYYFTVDVWKGLRAWDSITTWTDAADLTVTDTSAGTRPSEGLSHLTDASAIVRGVYVIGANAAGTGLVMDGTGLPGPIATLTDTTCDSATRLADVAGSYLDSWVIGQRGTIGFADWTPTPAGVHPGASDVVLTDAAAGVSGTYQIMEIAKSFKGSGRQDWSLSYGGLPPSMTRAVRRQTRTIQS